MRIPFIGHHSEHTGDGGSHTHDHTHSAIDPTLLTTEKGIWAVKWSMVGLLLTAFLQAAVVVVASSMALLAIFDPQFW